MRRSEGGFTIVEVLVAIIILTVGLLALAQTSGAVSTMIGRGKQDTQASVAVQRVLEDLRQRASTTTPKCTSLAGGTRSGPAPGMTLSWTVSGSGESRSVAVTVTYRVSRGTRTETVHTVLGCV